MTDFELIDLYLDNLRFANRSPETLKVRRYYLKKAAREVGLQAESVIELRHKFQAWLMRPSLQPQTRGLWITTLHCFYVWANQEGYFQRVVAPNGALADFDPTFGLTKPPTKKGKPHPIPDEELRRATELAAPKMRCWLLLGGSCGLRCKEIALLEREQIDLDAGFLHLVHTKGSKPRDVPLFPNVATALIDYGLPESGRLWADEPSEVSRKGNDHLHRHDIPSTMHALRHRALTKIYQFTQDALYTADIAGHSSTEILRIYAKPRERTTELAAAVDI